MFPSTRDLIFRLFFTLIASFPLSVWVEREYTYRRRLDERLEAIQHHVAVIFTLHVPLVIYWCLQLNPAVLAVGAGVQCSLPIMARAIPANPNMLGQSSMEGIVQRPIPGNTSNIIGLSDGDAKRHARRSGPRIKSPPSTNPPPVRLSSLPPPHPLSSTPHNNPPCPTLPNNPFNLTPSDNSLNPTPRSGLTGSSRRKLAGRVKTWFR